MFTVKAIDSEGCENIFETSNVYARSSGKLTSSAPYVIDAVLFQTTDGADVELGGQGVTVYVMNDNGKTVSKYSVGVNNGEISNIN